MGAFSPDPAIAEQQMTAIIFYLATFGHMRETGTLRRTRFVRERIGELVRHRSEPMGHGDLRPHLLAIDRQTAYFEGLFQRLDRSVRPSRDEAEAAGASVNDVALARLRRRCYELFQRFDARGRRELLAIVDARPHGGGVADGRERRFRDELLALPERPDAAVPPSPATGASGWR